MVNIKNIPAELLVKREIIECNFVMSGYKDPLSIAEYTNIVNGEDIITDSGVMYYGILQGMLNNGYQDITNMAVYEFLADKPEEKDIFNQFGGWESIKDMTALVSVDNVEVYYDELTKANFLIRLWKKGFPVLDRLEKFSDMSSEDVYDYYEYMLSDISIGKIEKIRAEDLTTGYAPYIEEWDEGGQVGNPISSPMLNYRLLGTHDENLLLHLAGIGRGKTTSAIHWYILPALKAGKKIVIVANEQGISEWRQMILSTVLFNEIGTVKGFSRNRMMKGHYEADHKVKMYEAAKWLGQYAGNLLLIPTQDYDVSNVKKIMTKYSKIGYSLFVIDTFKPTDDSSDKAWGLFSEVAKQLFLQAKKLKVCAIATCQLAPEALRRAYLDLTCIAKAKAIAETATQVVMLRDITPEEKLKIHGYIWGDNGRKQVELDPNKDYIMVFTPKNRFGPVDPQIIMERNLNFNSYKDVCWYNCPYDQFKK